MNVLYKTKMCNYQLAGNCRHGSECLHAHSEFEIRRSPDFRKTKLCRMFQKGLCTSTNCNRAHGEEERRIIDKFYKTKICKYWKYQGTCIRGSECYFAHNECRTALKEENEVEAFRAAGCSNACPSVLQQQNYIKKQNFLQEQSVAKQHNYVHQSKISAESPLYYTENPSYHFSAGDDKRTDTMGSILYDQQKTKAAEYPQVQQATSWSQHCRQCATISNHYIPSVISTDTPRRLFNVQEQPPPVYMESPVAMVPDLTSLKLCAQNYGRHSTFEEHISAEKDIASMKQQHIPEECISSPFAYLQSKEYVPSEISTIESMTLIESFNDLNTLNTHEPTRLMSWSQQLPPLHGLLLSLKDDKELLDIKTNSKESNNEEWLGPTEEAQWKYDMLTKSPIETLSDMQLENLMRSILE